MKNHVLDTVSAREVPSFVAKTLYGAALVLAVTASAACTGGPGGEESAGNIDSELQTCSAPTKDRVGNSLQQVYDALYRDDTGTGFQRVNKGSLPAVMATKSWVTPVNVPTSSWRAFGVISTPLEQKNGGHEGVDIGVGRNTPVKAAAAGTIVYRLDSCVEGDRWCGNGWGNHVVIDHGDNVFTRYAHLTKASSSVGLQVSAGTVIGLSGSTGLSDGPHLHFELGLHGGQFDSCSAPQNFWKDANGAKGGVYDARLLAFGQVAADPRANAIDKTCRVSAGGDRTTNVRPEASESAAPYGVILAGQRVKVRGFIGDWTSIEEATLDGTGTKPAGSKVGHAVGLNAFIHVGQIDLNDCR
jgi:murein DD-endopeptidase MepM/ murein hydrolase activator NlpD